MTIKTRKGIVLHVISSGVEPSICSARTPGRWRKRAAKKTRQVKISRVIIPVTMSRKMYRASTCPAIVEACCGHNGKLLSIPSLCRRLPGYGEIQSPQDKEKSSEHENRCSRRQPQNIADHRTVFSGLRIVVIAIEQHGIDGIADLALRGLNQSHAQIFRWKIHAVEVA